MALLKTTRKIDQSWHAYIQFIIQHIDTLPKYGKKKLAIYVGPGNIYPTIYESYTCELF